MRGLRGNLTLWTLDAQVLKQEKEGQITQPPNSHLSHFEIYTFVIHAAAAAKSLQSCLTLCDPIDGSPPGSSVPGILQARTLECVAISFSSAWKWKVKVKLLSPVWLFATPWTAAHQAPPSMGFSRQEYWSGVPLPTAPQIDFFWQVYINFISISIFSHKVFCLILGE